MNVSNPKQGLDFQELARGGDRNYSCSYLVSIDWDLLILTKPDKSYVDVVRDVLSAHTDRILEQINQRSGREIDQFCFGSTYLQLNPNYRRLERMEPLTWRKEGISNHWAGPRGFRKSCCKVCCSDKLCGGCRECLCKQGCVRGGYDGLVVLCALTKDSVVRVTAGGGPPGIAPPTGSGNNLDPEEFSLAMEYGLTLSYFQKDSRVVYSGREKFTNEHNPKLGKQKKHAAYCVYMAYRLDRAQTASSLSSGVLDMDMDRTEEDGGFDSQDEDDVRDILEELEDKNLVSRLTNVEQENKELREKVKKLEHGRGWLEERLMSLEAMVSKYNSLPKISD